MFLKNGANKFFKRTELIIESFKDSFGANVSMISNKSSDYGMGNTKLNESKSFLKTKSKLQATVNNSKVTTTMDDTSKISSTGIETNTQKMIERITFIDSKRENHFKAYLIVLKYLFYTPRFNMMPDEGLDKLKE